MEQSRYSETVPPCQHSFVGGLCQACLCPETRQEHQRADNAIENAQALRGTWFDEWHCFLTEEQAILLAWRTHHRAQG